MVSNFFKVALRNLFKNKTYSLLNISGLAIGIACAGLIFLWVEDEVGFDGNEKNKDRLYFAMVNQHYNAAIITMGSTPGELGPSIQKEIPGITNTCRASEGQTPMLFTLGTKSLYASGRFIEASLFDMFTLSFKEGNAKTAFTNLYSLVITEKTARKFFGDDQPVIGRTIRADNKQDYVITGVLKDLPLNSSMQFEWVAPFQIWYQQSMPWAQQWRNNCLSTYIQLAPGASEAAVGKQLYDFVQKREPTSIGHVILFSMNDWHLRNAFSNGKLTGSGQIAYVRMFSVIAWIILFIACINFMNLATARSEKRAREVGVRKVLGARKNGLVIQFLGEAFIMATLAAAVAVILMMLALPYFNMLVVKNLTVSLRQPSHAFALAGITIICGLIAGSYPALYLSSFMPVTVLKGMKLKTGSAATIRKGLVILQFSASIILIISTIIIYQQIQHVKTRQLGFTKDHLIQIDLQGDLAFHYQAVRNELMATGKVENVALSDHPTIYGGNNTDEITWDGKPAGNKVLISSRNVSPEFMQTSGIRLLEGRDLKPSDSIVIKSVVNVIVTESLAKMMGNGSAVGKILRSENQANTMQATIVGVVNDYVYGNVFGKPDPVLFACVPAQHETVMYVRTRSDVPIDQSLAALETVIKRNNPAFPFQYRFVDDQFNEMFLNETMISALSKVFAVLAIIISCLGLFGLAAYTADRRTKEIGIRKVLGASVAGISAMLSRDFLKLVLLSCAISFPVAGWIMHVWLQQYEYRVGISWMVFAGAGFTAMIITLATVVFQSVRAAVVNPARSLRSE